MLKLCFLQILSHIHLDGRGCVNGYIHGYRLGHDHGHIDQSKNIQPF